jgi:glucokinase
MTYYLGLDIGATNIRCGIATADGELVASRSQPTPHGPSVDAVTRGIEAIAAATVEEAGIEPARVDAAGIASIGPLDRAAGTIRDPVNLDGDLGSIPVRDTVAGLLPDVPICMCNDAVAGALTEYCLGDPATDLAYVTISTGIGAGVVVDDHLLDGAHGNAAEMGHITLDPDADRPCGCGGYGHWEAFAGGANIVDFATDLAESAVHSATVIDTESRPAEVFGASGSDPVATETIDRLGDYNAQGLAALAHAFDPERIAIGGAIARNNETLVVDPIRNRIDQYLMGSSPKIHLTPFGDEVVLRGALILAGAIDPSVSGNGSDFYPTLP